MKAESGMSVVYEKVGEPENNMHLILLKFSTITKIEDKVVTLKDDTCDIRDIRFIIVDGKKFDCDSYTYKDFSDLVSFKYHNMSMAEEGKFIEYANEKFSQITSPEELEEFKKYCKNKLYGD